MVISIDDLYEFKACPLRYKFMKIDKLPKMQITENDGMRETLHTMLSYFYLHLQQGTLLSMTDLKEKLSSLINVTHLFDVQTAETKKKRQEELKMIEMLNLFHRKQKYSPDRVVATNVDFQVPFGDQFFIKGKIFLIRETNRGMEIVKFKTSTQHYDEFWQRTDMNMTFQAMAFQSMFKKAPDSLCIYDMRTTNQYFTERKKKDYQRLYKSINMMKKTIQEGWFYPRESYHCNKCPAKTYCMEWS